MDKNKSYNSELIFCPKCLADTLPISTGNLWTLNFVGTTLKDVGSHCNICNSFVVEKRFIIYGVPVYSYGYFRIIRLLKYNSIFDRDTNFISRKLKNQKIK